MTTVGILGVSPSDPILAAVGGNSTQIVVSLYSLDGFTGDVTLNVAGSGFTIVGSQFINFTGTESFNIAFVGDGNADFNQPVVFTLSPSGGLFISASTVTRHWYELEPHFTDFQLPHAPPLAGPGQDIPNSGLWYRDPRPLPQERRQRRGQIWPR